MLDGPAHYDDLTATEQAVVRAEWGKRMTADLLRLNFAHENAQAGKPYAELDEHGNAIRRHPHD